MLFTDFVTIGTAGATVDGREIQEQWLIDAAEQYDPEIYTATINSEHQSWYGSLGTVHAVRLGKNKQGKTTLEAQLRPNYRLIQFNMAGQKLFTSMEIEPKFSDTGKGYLEGLAVTDDPASLSTTMLQLFSKTKRGKVLTEPFEFSLGLDGEDAMPEVGEEKLFKRFLNFLGKGNKPEFKNEPLDQEETEMTPEQFSALEDHIKNQGDVMQTLSSTMTTLAEKFSQAPTPTPTPKPEGETETPKEPEESDVVKLSKQVEKLTTLVNEMSEEKPPKFSGHHSGDNEEPIVFA